MRILVTYATMAGSTAEAAQAIADVLAAKGVDVDVRPLAEAPPPDGYDLVVVGGPMILGWHRQASGYVRRHRAAWRRVPLALFALAISLTEPETNVVDGLTIYVDEQLPKPAAQAGRRSLRERYADLGRYVRPMLRAAGTRPLSAGLFGGRLEYGRLPWWGVLFVMGVIRAPAGDRRNWAAIEAWAASLVEGLATAEDRRDLALA